MTNAVYAVALWLVGAAVFVVAVHRYDRHCAEQVRRREAARRRICRELSRHAHPSYRSQIDREFAGITDGLELGEWP